MSRARLFVVSFYAISLKFEHLLVTNLNADLNY